MPHYFFKEAFMKNKILAVVLLSLSTGAFAAKFTIIEKHKDTKIQALSSVFAKATKDKNIFGDCDDLASFKVEKKETESNINTMKQFHIINAGIFDDNGETTTLVKLKDASKISRTLLAHDSDYDWMDDNQKVIFEGAVTKIANSLKSATGALNDKTKELYETLHSDEDGTWSVLSIYDTKNQEILMMKVGFCGT